MVERTVYYAFALHEQIQQLRFDANLSDITRLVVALVTPDGFVCEQKRAGWHRSVQLAIVRLTYQCHCSNMMQRFGQRPVLVFNNYSQTFYKHMLTVHCLLTGQLLWRPITRSEINQQYIMVKRIQSQAGAISNAL